MAFKSGQTWNGVSVRDFLATCPPEDPRLWVPCSECGAPLASDGLGCTGMGQHGVEGPRLRLYASRTGTIANLKNLYAHGHRLLATPAQLKRYGRKVMPGWCYAIDNGAWTAHKNGATFDADAFRMCCDQLAHGADFITVPDIVAGGHASLDLSLSWLPELRGYGRPLLIPVQDGMVPDDLARARVLGRNVGLFVGGTTAWKLETLNAWGQLARRWGCRMHVGRVNSAKRIRLCIAAGATSADGTSATKYSVTAAPLAKAAA